jgi:indole-3-glycerol phosphate synthase
VNSTIESPNVLAAIVAATRKIVAVRAERRPLAGVEREAAATPLRQGCFASALARERRINVIAECKRRSPSRGVLKASYDPATIAAGYANAGAAAVSVLTEPTFFDGALEHLAAVRLATDVPILRKDFVVDRYQIFESRAAGADAVLLIAAALTPPELRHLHREARDAGLDVLVEVHDLSELQAAIDCGASIIGVNNRDLRTLVVTTELSAQAVELIPETVIAVAESGLKTLADLQRLKSAGYDAFLIGETLMTTDDPGKTLAGILGEQAA